MTGYRPRLDVLRAGAVISVLYFHLWNTATSIGAWGVKLFFIISGFLITAILLEIREKAASSKTLLLVGLRSFYIRRALRLWPAYFCLLLLFFVINHQNIRSVIGWHALFLSNILFAWRNEYVPWTTAAWWSLSVEEQFYLLWPAIILGLSRRILPLIVALLVVAGLAWGIYVVPTAPAALWVYHLLPSAFAYLGAGAALALVYERGVTVPWIIGRTGWLGGVALAAIAMTNWAIWGYDVLILLLMVWLVIWGLADHALKSSLWQPILSVGRVSYGIYLYHLPVMYLLSSSQIGAFAERGPALFCAGALLSIFLAMLSWLCLEQPFNRLKRAFPYGEQRKE